MAEKIPSIKELSANLKQRVDIARLSKEKLVIDWSKIFVLFPRYCHILLIAPHHASDTYTDYSIQGADDFFAFAKPIGTVKYLRDAQATRANVEKEIGDFNPRLVVHYDHGSINAVYGESAMNTPQPVIDTANVDKLRFRVMSTVSCLSASGLGPTAIGKGCTSYVGYNDLHWIVTSTHQAFWNCASMVHKMLVLGYSVQTGYDAAIITYDANIAYYSSIGDVFTALHLQIDRDRLTLLGSKTATTCLRRLEIIRPHYEVVRRRLIPELVWPPKLEELEMEYMERVNR
jgi:hypothetical protein